MPGDSFHRQGELVMTAGLRELIPDHILVPADKGVGFSRVRKR